MLELNGSKLVDAAARSLHENDAGSKHVALQLLQRHGRRRLRRQEERPPKLRRRGGDAEGPRRVVRQQGLRGRQDFLRLRAVTEVTEEGRRPLGVLVQPFFPWADRVEPLRSRGRRGHGSVHFCDLAAAAEARFASKTLHLRGSLRIASEQAPKHA